MAEYKFRIPTDWTLDPYHANSVHIVGLDGIPWPCRISVAEPDEGTSNQQRILTVNRNQDESGRLYLLYDFNRLGEHLICTGTLMPNNDVPYDLPIELARGTLNRMRNQTSIWEEGGLVVEESTRQKIQDATSSLGNSSVLCRPRIGGRVCNENNRDNDRGGIRTSEHVCKTDF